MCTWHKAKSILVLVQFCQSAFNQIKLNDRPFIAPSFTKGKLVISDSSLPSGMIFILFTPAQLAVTNSKAHERARVVWNKNYSNNCKMILKLIELVFRMLIYLRFKK